MLKAIEELKKQKGKLESQKKSFKDRVKDVAKKEKKFNDDIKEIQDAIDLLEKNKK